MSFLFLYFCIFQTILAQGLKSWDFFKYNNITPPLNKEEDPSFNSDNWGTRYTSPDTENLDMGLCSCDLSNLCDYRCCCDTSCDAKLVEEWRSQKICLNENLRMTQYMCDSSEKDENQRNNRLFVKDQIFNMMCVFYDRSGDMGEFYHDKEGDPETNGKLINNWNKKFFLDDSGSEEDKSYSYKKVIKGNIINKSNETDVPILVYGPDSSGNCVKNKVLKFMEKIDTTCKINEPLEGYVIEIYQSPNKKEEPIRFSFLDNSTTSGIFNYKFKYNKKSEGDETVITLSTIERNKKDNDFFKTIIEWENEEKTDDSILTKTSAKGYLQGSPLTFKIGEKVYKGTLFNGDNNGECGEEGTDSESKIYINFQNSLVYSCYTSNTSSSSIAKNLTNESNKISIGKKKLVNNEWLEVRYPKEGEVSEGSDGRNGDLNIVLEIITTKSGLSGREDLVIEDAKIKYSWSDKKFNKSIVRFQVKFAEVTYDMFENTDDKITSIKKLPSSLFKTTNGGGEYLRKNKNSFSFIFLLLNIINCLFL